MVFGDCVEHLEFFVEGLFAPAVVLHEATFAVDVEDGLDSLAKRHFSLEVPILNSAPGSHVTLD